MFLSAPLIFLTHLSSIALASPTSGFLQAEQPSTSCKNGTVRLYQPELHNIYIYANTPSFPSTSNTFNVMKGSSSGSEQQQIAVWRNVPASTNCRLRWSVVSDRSFSVYDNGLVSSQQLVGLPPGNITADTIRGMDNTNSPQSALDFTFWPEVAGPHDHLGPTLQCGNEVVIRLYKDSRAAGSVTLEQIEQNGLYLEIDC